MVTECNARTFEFHGPFGRNVTARFDGGRVSSDGGGMLLREVDERFRFIEQFSRCFTDHRDQEVIEHPLIDLVKQRVFGLCLGYEDLIDHDTLRHDPLLAVMVGKADPEGTERKNPRDCGKALAGKSTLNRLELTPVGADQCYVSHSLTRIVSLSMAGRSGNRGGLGSHLLVPAQKNTGGVSRPCIDVRLGLEVNGG